MRFSKESRFVAVAETPVIYPNLYASVSDHLRIIDIAKSSGVGLLIFPELSLTSFEPKRRTPNGLTIDSPALRRISEQSNDIEIVVGFAENDGRKVYNSVAVFAKRRLKHVHRKINLVRYQPWHEDRMFESGREVSVYNSVRAGRSGILICNDFWNPGLVHATASCGIDLLIVPTNSVSGGLSSDLDNQDMWLSMLKLYARLYGIYIAFANCIGQNSLGSYWGGSCVIDPTGALVSKGSSLPIAVLDFNTVLAAKSRHPLLEHNPIDVIRDQMGSLCQDGDLLSRKTA